MKIQKANLKSGLKIVKASTAEMGGKTERPRVRVRGYIRIEMLRWWVCEEFNSILGAGAVKI